MAARMMNVQTETAPAGRDETVEKVLRRAKISRLTRNLKSRLALASFKTKCGLQKYGLDSIEPQFVGLVAGHSDSAGTAGSTSTSTSASASTASSCAASCTSEGSNLSTPNATYLGHKHEFAAFDAPQQHSYRPFPREARQVAQTSMAAGPLHSHPQADAGPCLDEGTAGATGAASVLRIHAVPTLRGQQYCPPSDARPPSASGPAGVAAAAQLPVPAAAAMAHPLNATHRLAPPAPLRKRARIADEAKMGAPALPVPVSVSQDMRAPADPRSDGCEPRTPPPAAHAASHPHTPMADLDDGASLLLYLASSPGRGVMRTPHTPDFNLNEYLNLFTPSPANMRHSVTPSGIARARQRLMFE